MLTESFSILSSGGSPLGGISTNLPSSTLTVPSWRCSFLSWHCRACILRTLQTGTNCEWGWFFLFMKYAEVGANASTWPIWLSSSLLIKGDYHPAKRMITIDQINIYNAWNNTNENRKKKHQSLLLRGIGSWSRSTVTTIVETQLSFLLMVTT